MKRSDKIAFWIFFVLMALSQYGCSGLKMEGDCVATRKVEITYQCTDGSKMEHNRIFRIDMD